LVARRRSPPSWSDTDATYIGFFETAVDATKARRVTEFPRLLKASFVPFMVPPVETRAL
jgi:hypothetical protein